MINATLNMEPPVNEPVREYRPNTPETASLQAALDAMTAWVAPRTVKTFAPPTDHRYPFMG